MTKSGHSMSSCRQWMFLLTLLLNLSLIVANTSSRSNKNNNNKKGQKVLPLFSIVNFKNAECKSQSSISNGQSSTRNGTCYTSNECSDKGGNSSGNCASGFGVCCLFLVSTSSSSIKQNSTYLRNPGFPSAYSGTSSLTYTVNKCSPDICWLRLDFELFVTVGPTSEVAAPTVGSTCPDQFKLTTSTGFSSSLVSGQTIPILCGTNSGQHIYADIGNMDSDLATISFTFSTAQTTIARTWEIKISQLTCSSPSRPPNGCLQYYTTTSGRFTTFNFNPTSSAHLDNQLYTACIRKSSGSCCIRYNVCDRVPNAFTLDGMTVSNNTGSYANGAVDTSCSYDYITIPGSSNSCSVTGGKLSTKYCGRNLGVSTVNNPSNFICDCTGTFQIGVRTDNTNDGVVGAAVSSNGVCLDFMQIPCV